MRCNDCIHYKTCKQYGENIFGNHYEYKVEEMCNYFKAKSLFVELPCKVGDVVYEIRDPKIFNEKIVELKVIAINFLVSSCCKHLSITAENGRGANLLLELGDFGKTVFLTKEEAERKLKEIEGK